MKKSIILALSVVFLVSCSSFKMKTEIDESFSLKQLKSSAMIIRLSSSSAFTKEAVGQNIEYWLESFKKIKSVKFYYDISENLGVFNPDVDRFYQKSINNKFLKYKSLGVINTYLRNNSAEIMKIMKKGNHDSLVIYEVDMGFSIEAQFIDLDSVVVVVDRELNTVYMNHQKNMYNIDTFDEALVKKHLLDRVANRFTESLKETGHIEFNKDLNAQAKKKVKDKKSTKKASGE